MEEERGGRVDVRVVIVPSLSFYDPMHNFRIAEERNGKFAVPPSFHIPGQDLVYQIIYSTVQKVVPRKFEKQILYIDQRKRGVSQSIVLSTDKKA